MLLALPLAPLVTCRRRAAIGRRACTVDLVFEAILAFFDFFDSHAKLIHLLDEVVDRACDRVGQPSMIEFRDILARALALDNLARDTDDRRIRRRRRYDHRTGSDSAPASNPDRPNHRGARTDHHLVLDRGMPFFLLEARPAQRHPLVDEHDVPDLDRLNPLDAPARVAEEPP